MDGSLLRAQLDLTVVALRHDIARLEVRLARVQQGKASRRASGAEPAGLSGTDAPSASLRARRLERVPTKPAELAVELDAASTLPVDRAQETAFFSPSCHCWRQTKLLSSREWTPFSSPRRSDSLGSASQQPKWPVLQTTDANRRRGRGTTGS